MKLFIAGYGQQKQYEIDGKNVSVSEYCFIVYAKDMTAAKKKLPDDIVWVDELPNREYVIEQYCEGNHL